MRTTARPIPYIRAGALLLAADPRVCPRCGPWSAPNSSDRWAPATVQRQLRHVFGSLSPFLVAAIFLILFWLLFKRFSPTSSTAVTYVLAGLVIYAGPMSGFPPPIPNGSEIRSSIAFERISCGLDLTHGWPTYGAFLIITRPRRLVGQPT